MAKQKGNAVLVKMDISGVFTDLAGLRATSFRVSDGNSNVSAKDSPGRWQEMLAGTGHKSVMVSGSGVFDSGAVHAKLLDNKLNEVVPDFQVIMPGLGEFEGPFVIDGDLEYAGDHEGEATFSFSLASAGELTWTAE